MVLPRWTKLADALKESHDFETIEIIGIDLHIVCTVAMYASLPALQTNQCLETPHLDCPMDDLY